MYRREEGGRNAETEHLNAMMKVKCQEKMGTSGSVKEQAKGDLWSEPLLPDTRGSQLLATEA
ncbi:hypothetical protein KSB_62400 [Ktedonobacter robiniae]|uniref:Integrase catalytic domain-containing protein n=1 Tax=Ktedonobacter robiniae TaxID=2778365 RepID=A0ABQ3UYI1_9CHLR|nr:hypothetical protein KSB_62400 [Ktedonobacter robiniae]